jgi:Ca-activated chloride channel family protein
MTSRTENRKVFPDVRRHYRPVLIFVAFLALHPTLAFGEWVDFWLTPDQQGRRLAEQGDYLEAAETFEDAGRRGVAYFRGGDFESAASVFGRIRSPEASYNRGNALVMLGRYDEAIQSYEKALADRPGWKEADENLAIARARKEKLAPPETDSGGTGGQLGADEIVFDESGRVSKSGSDEVTEGGETLSEKELRSVWLRRVQNDPADFLRTRFSYQLYRDQQEEHRGPVAD